MRFRRILQFIEAYALPTVASGECDRLHAAAGDDAVATNPAPDEPKTPAPQEKPPPKVQRDDVAKGMIIVGASAAAFSTMSMFVQLISHRGIPSMQIVFMNSVMRCILAVPQCWLALAAKWPFTSQKVIVLVAINALAGALGISCAFYAYSKTPLGDATAILFTSPVWTALLATIPWVLGERLQLLDGVSLLLCLGGVVMVENPGKQDVDHLKGSCVALAGAMLSGVRFVSVRKLGKGNMPPAVLVFVYSLLTVALLPLLMLMLGQRWTAIPSDGEVWGYIIGMGLVGYLASWLLNKGMQMGPVATISLARNMDISFAFVLQATVLGDSIELLPVLGSVLISAITLLRFWKTYSDEKAKQLQDPKDDAAAVQARDGAPVAGTASYGALTGQPSESLPSTPRIQDKPVAPWRSEDDCRQSGVRLDPQAC